ncbi:protein involved in polysaccharide export with SLBB domain [Humitalea rosea]|uniref:Protein involved in polysaccharide export with SLBB domain n=1 Tax=Humitalea rosea TaxID=990373 RepID=A0A2W7IM59_9PROT|nr:polysaccharide biosynthesis/export family protein [Humitalea rosea]PZW40427.1 protein involved in polysaccharide export with SLBB domain [Humitalea rosea]
MRFASIPFTCILLLLAGCTTANLRPVETDPAGFAPWAEVSPAYRVSAGDKLRVQFLLTPEMGETSLVAPDGAIGLRAAGRVMAGGKTTDELEAAIALASRRTLTEPIVTVSLEEAGGSMVFVGGAVKRGGAYPLSGRRGVIEQVLLAGGFEPEARVSQVILIRRNPQNQPMLRTLDLQQQLNTGGLPSDVPLFPGDIIFVPRSRIAEVNLWVDQFITRAVPFNPSFSYTINRNIGAGFVP